MSISSARQDTTTASRKTTLLIVVQLGFLFGAAAFAASTPTLAHWPLATLVAITAFALISEFMSVLASSGARISGSFLGIILATVTLGGAPAALIGVLIIVATWVRTRERPLTLLANLVNYAWFPLLSGLVFHELVAASGANHRSVVFYLCVFVAFVVALALNFLGTMGYSAWRRGESFRQKVVEIFIPVLPAELFSALLTLGGVYVYEELGTVGLVLSALVFVIYQYLVGEMLTSKRRSVQLQRIATTDELTGLVNREHFRTVIGRRIAASTDSEATFPVLLMDLDRFKEINDTLGHHYGDVLLQDLGPRLIAAVGEGGVVARMGGDEFGILLGEVDKDLTGLDEVVQRLFAYVCQPFTVDELSLEVGASVGVSRYPYDGDDANALLRCADIAMYAAKDAQTDYKVYDVEQNQHSMRRLSVISDIRRALASDEIVVHYQPIVDLAQRQVRGAEGLVRWQHPVHGLIPPGAFVQTVEQTGLIEPLTHHVLESAIAQCAAWRRAGQELSVAVNLSVRNLLDKELPRQIARLLNTYGVPPQALQLEITESMIMSDPERALATVSRLSALGLRLSVDDFGTGYSSLANLRKMPIDELKIDRSFVSPMLRDESDLIIVRSTINLGHDLGLHVIAEGVEDSETLESLHELGCDLVQGFHLSRPMSGADFDVWLAASPLAHNTAPAPAPRRLAEEQLSTGLGHSSWDLSGLTFRSPENF